MTCRGMFGRARCERVRERERFGSVLYTLVDQAVLAGCAAETAVFGARHMQKVRGLDFTDPEGPHGPSLKARSIVRAINACPDWLGCTSHVN
jgi:hypothetical protein